MDSTTFRVRRYWPWTQAVACIVAVGSGLGLVYWLDSTFPHSGMAIVLGLVGHQTLCWMLFRWGLTRPYYLDVGPQGIGVRLARAAQQLPFIPWEDLRDIRATPGAHGNSLRLRLQNGRTWHFGNNWIWGRSDDVLKVAQHMQAFLKHSPAAYQTE